MVDGDGFPPILGASPHEVAHRGERHSGALHARLVGVYFKAAAVAVFGGSALYGTGLELTARQIVIGLGIIAPLAFIPVAALDILAIRLCLRPIRAFLRGETTPDAGTVAQNALVRAVNLPILSALRVLVLHIPAAVISITMLMLWLNEHMALGIRPDQFAMLWLLTLLVGSGHAILEHFMVADAIRPVCHGIGRQLGALTDDTRRRIIPVGTRQTLVFVSIFMVLVPLAVLGYTLTLKVKNLLIALGVQDVTAQMVPLYAWIGLLVVTCMAAVLFMSVKAGREVTRSTEEMSDAMRRVERDEFTTPLVVTSASEFVGLYEGFNAMTVRLRELIETREKRAAEITALREKQHFMSLIENASDFITLIAADGTIRYESPSVERNLGFRPEERVGRDAFDFVHPEDIERVRTAFGRLVATGRMEQGVEFRCRQRSGSWQILEAIGKAVEDPGGEVVYVFNSRDVTERRAVEAALRESEERLRKANRLEALGRMSGGIAHNFNNLLTVIIGQCNRALGMLGPDEPVRANLEQVREAATRSAHLTKQILATGGRQFLQPRRVDVNRAVGQWAQALRPALGDRVDLTLTTSHVPLLAEVDPAQLEHVILNLALNARDAMPSGGHLRIETDSRECDERVVLNHPGANAGAYVRVKVADNGIGMDAETKTHLFEPFFTTKNLAERTGLGLATVHGVIQQHGGFIEVESEPGHGTTFSIYLPRVLGPDAVAAKPGAARVEATGSCKTIFLVEDEREVLALVREVLESNGFTVLWARHPGEALLVAERHEGSIDLLLTDIVMPHMTGWELARRMRTLRPELRVVYMSGYAHEASGPGRGLDPHTPFLEKPFQFEQLLRILETTLREAA